MNIANVRMFEILYSLT